jgi:mono/diheme cytochrome c family protein
MPTKYRLEDIEMRMAHLGLVAAGAVIAVTYNYALGSGDPQKGRALAQQFCAECHAIGSENVLSPKPEAPSFSAVASTAGMTTMALNVFFQTPHRAMPNLILKPEQKDDIIAYIMTLKK